MQRTFSLRQILLVIALLSFIFEFYSCNKVLKPRTVYFSGSSYTYTFETADSVSPLFLNLGYYIEISDTGETKLMTRPDLDAPKECYIIKLPDSVKNEILNQASKDTCFLPNDHPINDEFIYDGFTYHIHYINDGIDKSVAFIPHYTNPVQKRILTMFEAIQKNFQIVKRTNIDLRKYEKRLDEKFRKSNPLPPPPRNNIKFIPPVIKPDSEEIDFVPDTGRELLYPDITKGIKICSSSNFYFQLRVWFSGGYTVPSQKGLWILNLQDNDWSGAFFWFEYGEKGYELVEKINDIGNCDSIVQKFIENDFLKLPTMDFLKKDFYNIDSKGDTSRINVMDGEIYTFELIKEGKYKRYEYYCPVSYSKFYKHIPELSKASTILKIIFKSIHRKFDPC